MHSTHTQASLDTLNGKSRRRTVCIKFSSIPSLEAEKKNKSSTSASRVIAQMFLFTPVCDLNPTVSQFILFYVYLSAK